MNFQVVFFFGKITKSPEEEGFADEIVLIPDETSRFVIKNFKKKMIGYPNLE